MLRVWAHPNDGWHRSKSRKAECSLGKPGRATGCTFARGPSVPHLWAEPVERPGRAWNMERETDVVNLNRKAQVQLAQKQPVSTRMWLMCLPHKAAGPKKMKSMHGDSMGSRGFHPGVPTSTKCFKVFQTSLSFARTFMVILNIINSEIVLSHDHMT